MPFDEKDYWEVVRAGIRRRQREIRIRQISKAVMPPPGSPPFRYREAFAVAGRRPVSRAEYEDARLTFLNRFALADIDRPYSSIEEYARGVRLLEMRDARQKAFTRSRSGIPLAGDAYARYLARSPAATAGEDNGITPGYGPWKQGAPPIDRAEWEARGYSVEGIPDSLILPPNVRDLLGRILAKSPGRKRGRPSIGDRAMTGAERAQKHREKEKVDVDG